MSNPWQNTFNWRRYADTPEEFLSKLEKSKMTMATPEEQERGIVAHFAIKPSDTTPAKNKDCHCSGLAKHSTYEKCPVAPLNNGEKP